MATSPTVKVYKIFPAECQESGCPAEKGRVEFRNDGEITVVYAVRHKHPKLGYQNHWQRESFLELAREAVKLDPNWTQKFLASLAEV